MSECYNFKIREAKKLEAYRTANEIWKKHFRGYEWSENDFSNMGASYLMCYFTDSMGRRVEARYQPIGDDGFQLMANGGNPLALVELKEFLEKEGIENIVLLRSHPTTPASKEVEDILLHHSKLK